MGEDQNEVEPEEDVEANKAETKEDPYMELTYKWLKDRGGMSQGRAGGWNYGWRRNGGMSTLAGAKMARASWSMPT